ncbi:hypothetical protein BVC80_8903g10 [Macleaya cordata]|uniref:Uncharacterized protein n=1 Tax=Macleaya cordata TaxID=56857 RepID=A0A200RDU9_MACCD|nr:hypothetical protein BVC80_8903g10 [Macleaya cordata]
MNAMFAAIIFVGLITVLSNHRTMSGRVCQAEDFEKKFRKVVISEFLTVIFLLKSVLIGLAMKVAIHYYENSTEDEVVNDGKGNSTATKILKWLKVGEVLAVVVSGVSYILVIFVGVFLSQYNIAGIPCGGGGGVMTMLQVLLIVKSSPAVTSSGGAWKHGYALDHILASSWGFGLIGLVWCR